MLFEREAPQCSPLSVLRDNATISSCSDRENDIMEANGARTHRLPIIQYLNRTFLARCEAGRYSRAMKKLQEDINILLVMWEYVPGSEVQEQLQILQLQLYDAGILLFYHEEDYYPLHQRRDGCEASTSDDALAFFMEALHLAPVAYGTNQHVSTLTALTQIGQIYKEEGMYNDASMIFDHAMGLSNVLEKEIKEVIDEMTLFECNAAIFRSMGDIQYQMGSFDLAIQSYKRAIQCFKMG